MKNEIGGPVEGEMVELCCCCDNGRIVVVIFSIMERKVFVFFSIMERKGAHCVVVMWGREIIFIYFG